MAEQARLYAQANRLGLDAINAGTEIRLRADRRMGEVLIQAKETGEIREGRPEKLFPEGIVSIKLSAVGISRKQSHVTQQLAKLPEQVFEARIEIAKATQQRLTTGRMLVQSEVRADKIERINQGNVSLSTATRYPVVYADPPWRYEHSRTDNRQMARPQPPMLSTQPRAEQEEDTGHQRQQQADDHTHHKRADRRGLLFLHCVYPGLYCGHLFID